MSTALTFPELADVDLSFDGWGEHGIKEAVNEEALSVEDLIDLADSCARQLHGEQELLTLQASLSHGEEHACSLDGSGCGPEMPEPASQACRLQVHLLSALAKATALCVPHPLSAKTSLGCHLGLRSTLAQCKGLMHPALVQDLDFDRSMASWPQSHFAMVGTTAPCSKTSHSLSSASTVSKLSFQAVKQNIVAQILMCWLQVLWGAGVEQLSHDRQLAQQVVFLAFIKTA